jgi:hypothetical protein
MPRECFPAEAPATIIVQSAQMLPQARTCDYPIFGNLCSFFEEFVVSNDSNLTEFPQIGPIAGSNAKFGTTSAVIDMTDSVTCQNHD